MLKRGESMIGKILGNRYEIVEKIGGGGMALVYKAKCKLLNRYVAVKVLRPEFINDEEFINKFRRESQAAASLSHPNIVSIYDVGAEDNIYYIVMEYVNGKTLKQLIREKGKLSADETLDIAIKIAEALNHAHENHIVHRDIKPHNILVTEDGMVKVTDFGIARAATTSTVTNTSNVIGSVHYFSPEQARGGYTDEKSDIYSLGVVMYEMITGRVPFQGDSPISVALKHIQEDIEPPSYVDSSIPKSIDTIIMKCVQKDQSLRYSDAKSLLNDLKKAKNSDEIHIMNFNDSPTRIIPRIDDTLINPVENNLNNNPKKNLDRYNDYSDEKKGKSKSKFITLTAIISALLLTIGITAGFLWFRGQIQGQEVKVINVVGLHKDVAKQKIEELGLEFRIKNEVYSNEYEEGHVVYQSVEAGETVKLGYPIEVTISKGVQETVVPYVVNKHVDEAEIMLDDANLKSTVERVFSDIPKDYVISQSPDADERVTVGSVIHLVVSDGPEIEYVVVPNVIGENIDKAKSILTSLGLVVEAKYEFNENLDKDLIIWQSLTANTEVEKGTTINLTVSKGSEEIENPNTNNNSTADAEEDLITNNLSIILPKDRDEVEVTIYRIQDNEREVIYNKTHSTSEESISILVKGKKNAKYEVYFDGTFKGEI